MLRSRIRTATSNNLELVLLIFGLLGLASVGLYKAYVHRKAGRTEQELKTTKEVLENVKKGNDAVDRARADPDISKRLRERYKLK